MGVIPPATMLPMMNAHSPVELIPTVLHGLLVAVQPAVFERTDGIAPVEYCIPLAQIPLVVSPQVPLVSFRSRPETLPVAPIAIHCPAVTVNCGMIAKRPFRTLNCEVADVISEPGQLTVNGVTPA